MTLTPQFNAQAAYTTAGGAAVDDLAAFYATFGKAYPRWMKRHNVWDEY